MQQDTQPGWQPGLVAFAAVMLIVIGIFQILNGIAAIAEDTFYVLGRDYAFEVDVTTWGWIHLLLGIVVVLAGAALFSGSFWARLIAIFIAVCSAVENFFFVPYYPVWSILIIALNVVVIWALATYQPQGTAA